MKTDRPDGGVGLRSVSEADRVHRDKLCCHILLCQIHLTVFVLVLHSAARAAGLQGSYPMLVLR